MTWELALILAAVAVGFLLKSVAGFGGPLFAVPVLAPTLGVEGALVVVSGANIVANMMLIWEYREAAAAMRPLLNRLLAGGVAGAVVGTWLLTRTDDQIISLVVGVTVLAYIVVTIRNPMLRITEARGLRSAVPVGLIGGLVHGATGNSGQVFGTFIHALGLPRKAFVFALSVPFFSLGLAQTITLAALGSFTGPKLEQALWATLPVLIVTPLGGKLASRMNSASLRWIVLAMLAFAGIRLIWSAL